MEKRKSERYNVVKLKGKLHRIYSFRVRNISMEGLNLLCNFQPVIGSDYMIYLTDDGIKRDFEISVRRAEVHPFEVKENGLLSSRELLFSIGACFTNMDTDREEFLKVLIDKNVDFSGGFFVQKGN